MQKFLSIWYLGLTFASSTSKTKQGEDRFCVQIGCVSVEVDALRLVQCNRDLLTTNGSDSYQRDEEVRKSHFVFY